MTIETSVPRTRRALLAGGIGGLAAWAVASVGRASPVQADGEIIHVGDSIATATLPTAVTNGANSNTVLLGASTSGGIGVHGQSSSGFGLRGESTAGAGVYGSSTGAPGVRAVSSSAAGAYGSSATNAGVFGESIEHIGVVGVTATSGAPGVLGYGNGTGVIGGSGPVIPGNKPKTGVYGEATQDATSRGVWGYSPAGHAVRGDATTGRGVHGQATTGQGVRGFATGGVGLSGEATSGYALRTSGRVRLDKSAGQASIASGTASVTVTPGIDLTTTSAVVATLNGNAGGSTAVKRVAIDTTANTFTVYLTANATAAVKIAWIVLG